MAEFPTHWRVMPLESAMAAIIDYRGKSPNKTSSGIPLVTAKVVRGGRIFKPDEFIAPEDYQAWMRRGLPHCGDVVMTTEAPLGNVGQLDGTKVALAQRLITLRGQPDLLDNTFLKFAMQCQYVQEQLFARATGTTVVGIKQRELRQVHLPIPPLREQQAIVDILGSLDDKIELNRRTNQTLEQMARALFKSWFIDFDPIRYNQQRQAKAQPSQGDDLHARFAHLFPASFQDSPLGPIPEGWEVATLGDIADNPRRSVKTQDIDPNSPYIGLEHMPRRSIVLDAWDSAESITSNKYRFGTTDILFGKLRPYFHKVGVPAVEGICSTDILVIAPQDPAWFGFVLEHVSSDDFVAYANAASTGTKMPRTNWDYMSRYQVAFPPRELAEAFNDFVQPLVQRIHANIHESQTSGATRDALLPKLLSGELRASEAEQFAEEIA